MSGEVLKRLSSVEELSHRRCSVKKRERRPRFKRVLIETDRQRTRARSVDNGVTRSSE